MLARLFSLARRKVDLPSTPEGERVYAIGDIHGCHELLAALLLEITTDMEGRTPARTSIVFLGDYVDRGPRSCEVIAALMDLQASGGDAFCLMGNHEEVLLVAADGNLQAARIFNRIGGRATLMSYGLAAEDYDAAGIEQLPGLISEVVPQDHLEWMRNLPNSMHIGDYFFVHAGIRPGVAISDQSEDDLRWIRREFLDYPSRHPSMIVHGHSAFRDIDVQSNRIGIDTGAYATGRLTAVGLEGTERWFLQTGTPA